MSGLAFMYKPKIIYRSNKCGYCYATCDNKIFKATDGGHQLTKRILRGRVHNKKNKRNAIKKMPPLPKSGNSKCIGMTIAALHTTLHFYFL